MGVKNIVRRIGEKAGDKVAQLSKLSPNQIVEIQKKREDYLLEMPSANDEVAREITEKMIKAAKKAKIKVQPQVLMPQTSDGGAMQSGADGAICLSSSVPCRYSHSPVSVMSLDDINSMTEYIRLFLNKIGEMI